MHSCRLETARPRSRTASCLTATLFALLLAPGALGGGTPENMLLILDPSRPESLYIGNYYRAARNVPAANILYMDPANTTWYTFKDFNLDALRGYLRNAGIDANVDYIVVMPGAPFYMNATSLVKDNCSPVIRFSMSGSYTLNFIVNDILAGAPNFPVGTPNRFYKASTVARAFDASIPWLGGDPNTTAANAERYYIGCMLGYSGSLGNTLPEIISMIDRSVAADGTHPGGTFYFMNNTADPPRNVRANQFSAVVTNIKSFGGAADVIVGALPLNKHDCLGVMTGFADGDIAGAAMTLQPGAFADHLTSWAAAFDIGAQTKLSQWIAKGASGSWGAVEEPCNYVGKFPHARMHTFYYQGCSLGEAVFRSAAYAPFQLLLVGDPMTRPWAHLPTVDVTLPGGTVSGTIGLSASATTTHPSAAIGGFELLIDGRPSQTASGAAASFSIDTTLLSDGRHELRVLARDDTLVASTGRWLGEIVVDNRGRSASLLASPSAGDWRTPFVFDLSSAGGSVAEVRLIQNSRVVAAAPGAAATLTVPGAVLGAGPVTVQTEALFSDGRKVRSAPQQLTIAYSGGLPSAAAPVAFSYTKRIKRNASAVVELPYASDQNEPAPTFEVVNLALQAEIVFGPAGAFRLLRPNATASGTDSFTFRVSSAAGTSNLATVTLVYDTCPDTNGDGLVDQSDLALVLSAYDACSGTPEYNAAADLDNSGCVDQADLADLLAGYGQVCLQ